MKTFLHRIADTLIQAGVNKQACEIKSYVQVGNTIKVVASFIGIENPNQARSAILSATNGNLAAIPGTFIVNQESENTFTGHGFQYLLG
jgi:hypothetical protein